MPSTHNNDTREFRALRLRIMDRDDWTCTLCGFIDETRKSPQMHADHIIPKNAGGSDDPENMRALCRDCNLKKGAKTAQTRVTWFNDRWLQQI